MPFRLIPLVLTALVLSACEDSSNSAEEATGTPTLGSSSDISDFQGARAGQAEMGIQSLGYELIRTEGLTAYWFNRTTGACAQIVTDQGRYASVTMLPSQDC